MKVVHIINRIDGNGVTKAVFNLCQELSLRGIESEIIVSKPVDVPIPDGISLTCLTTKGLLNSNKKTNVVRRMAKYSLGGLLFYKLKAKRKSAELEQTLLSKNVDVVFLHCHYSKILYSNVSKLPCYMVLHNKKSLQLKAKWWLPSKINMMVMANAIKNKPKLAVSKSVKNDVRRRLKVADNMIEVIPNIIDAEDIRLRAGEQLLPLALSLQPKNYLVAVGRLDKQKRFDRLLKAYAEAGVSQHLVIAGDGRLRQRLERLAVTLDIAHKVHLIGHVNNPYPLIQQAKVLVLTSDYEGLPTVLIEALLLKTAVIATACSGVREAVKGAEGATIVPIRNMKCLVDAIRANCEQKNVIVQSQALEKNFAKEQVAERYLRLVSNFEAR
ncbi:glycosyltransferase [Agarivorans sp. B2Z047]|uniref:glycosyltransferase n=1 Tax=Agarivorans sp. B2Z047 TaxID=2652721 RepID=UPI00128E582A|nr:glycosyltransferase [Agarivorans sp. B2Z047]MPW28752.1 glycosyltransferase [Agarivorans sp. B2Z047]UQN41313.1 glycosyltransferase [Agarivorans sp. B2Z047]